MALSNTWGLNDSTVLPISRPRIHQRIVYNSHKRKHTIKYQLITTPNGMITSLYWSVQQKYHDATMLRMSGLMPILENFSLGPQHERPNILFKIVFKSTIQGSIPYTKTKSFQ